METGPGAPVSYSDVPKLELDQLIDQLVERAHGVQRTQGRLRALLHAIETVGSDLTLEAVLRNVVQGAADLTGAAYAALGVIGYNGDLEQFIYAGVDDETATRVGPLPQGRGLLGALITNPRPIRITAITNDPRSSGFPSHHPPMERFLGVPVNVRGEVFGNLYLANEKEAPPFSLEDEQLIIALAQAAATAISNARLYDESQLQQRWLAASVDIGAGLLTAGGEDPIVTVARHAIAVSEADLVLIALLDPSRSALVVEVAFGVGAGDLVGSRFKLEQTLACRVIEEGKPLLAVQGVDDDQAPRPLAPYGVDLGPTMILPLVTEEGTQGVLTIVRLHGAGAFRPSDLDMAASFATHASLALELANSRAVEQRMLLLEERDRIARDLHDHVIQELFAIGLGLESAAAALGRDNEIGQRISNRVEDIDRTIRRIRTSIFALHGALGGEQVGLRRHVLETVSEVTPLLGFAPHVSFSGPVDLVAADDMTTDVVAVIRESLTNVAKHAAATSTSVDLSAATNELVVVVSDNGRGIAAVDYASGTANLRTRAERRGGQCEISAGANGGTVVNRRVPLS